MADHDGAVRFVIAQIPATGHHVHIDDGPVLFDTVGTAVAGDIGKDKAVTEYGRVANL